MRLTRASIRPPFDAYILPSPSIFVHGSCLPVNKDRYGIRVDRLRPPACLRFPPTPLLRHGVGPLRLHLQSQTIFTLPFPLYPRHLRLCLRRRGSFPFQCAPKPTLAFPTCKDRHLHSVLQSARAAISLKSPTRQRNVMHGVQAVRHPSYFAEGRYVVGFDYSPHPECGLCNGF